MPASIKFTGEVKDDEGTSIARVQALPQGAIAISLGVGAYQFTLLSRREAGELLIILGEAVSKAIS